MSAEAPAAATALPWFTTECPLSLQPPGGELHHEGSLLLRQGQVSSPRLSVQCVWQAGVCGPGGYTWGLPGFCLEDLGTS